MFSSCQSRESFSPVNLQIASLLVKSKQFEFTPQAQRCRITSLQRREASTLPEQFRPSDFDADEILEGKLWLGSVEAALNSSQLRVRNIRYILTVADKLVLVKRSTDKDIVIADHALLEVEDFSHVNIAQYFDESIAWINSKLHRRGRGRDKDGGAVLVHCVQGKSRSVSVVLAYLMAKHNLSLDSALGMVKSKRSIAEPNYGFMSQLSVYERRLRE